MQSLASQPSAPATPQSPLFSVQSVDPLAKLTDALDTRIQADTFPTRAPPPWEVFGSRMHRYLYTHTLLTLKFLTHDSPVMCHVGVTSG